MAIVIPFTKKRIVNIKKENDDFDLEYGQRLMRMKTIQQFKDLLEDYEEFLPSQFQKLREISPKNFKKILSEIKSMIESVRRGQSQLSASVAFILVQPPMICIPRGFAAVSSNEKKKKVTWGEAFMNLSRNGMIKKLEAQGEKMFEDIRLYEGKAKVD